MIELPDKLAWDEDDIQRLRDIADKLDKIGKKELAEEFRRIAAHEFGVYVSFTETNQSPMQAIKQGEVYHSSRNGQD